MDVGRRGDITSSIRADVVVTVVVVAFTTEDHIQLMRWEVINGLRASADCTRDDIEEKTAKRSRPAAHWTIRVTLDIGAVSSVVMSRMLRRVLSVCVLIEVRTRREHLGAAEIVRVRERILRLGTIQTNRRARHTAVDGWDVVLARHDVWFSHLHRYRYRHRHRWRGVVRLIESRTIATHPKAVSLPVKSGHSGHVHRTDRCRASPSPVVGLLADRCRHKRSSRWVEPRRFRLRRTVGSLMDRRRDEGRCLRVQGGATGATRVLLLRRGRAGGRRL